MWISDSKTASKSDDAHLCALCACVNFADWKFDGCAAADFLRAGERIRSDLRWWNFCGFSTHSGEKYVVQHIVRMLMAQGKRWCIPKWADYMQKWASSLKSEWAHFWMRELAQKQGAHLWMSRYCLKWMKFGFRWIQLAINWASLLIIELVCSKISEFLRS